MRKFHKPKKFEKREEGRFRRGDSDRSERREFTRTPPSRRLKRESFQVTCEKCGKDCDVPFKPTGNKPIYCRDCFKQNDSSGFNARSSSFEPRRSNDRFESGSQSKSPSDDLEKINRKLDKIMKALKIE